MRINLVTPFAEKEAAKALGARWDATKKQWYIVDVADLTPFLRWIPHVEASTQAAIEMGTRPTKHQDASAIRRSAGVITTSSIEVPHCGCQLHPWVGCEHTG